MEVSEVVKLAGWFDEHIAGVIPKYKSLVDVLHSNTQGGQQRPVSDALDSVTIELSAMPVRELSAMQIRVLEHLEVAELVGPQGRRWLNKTVKSTSFDPATTHRNAQAALQKVDQAKQHLDGFRSTAETVGLVSIVEKDDALPYVINVIFQGEAGIDNIREWKTTAADWELIFAGVAAVVGEKSSDVRVLGTSTGSIILKLSATPLVTKALATIAKHIASIANYYLDIQLKREELERSRMMTDVMRKEFARLEKDRREQGKLEIIDAIKEITPKAKDEALAKLNKAIDKQITFSEKGGEVDFVTPEETDTDDEDEDLREMFDEVRNLIEEYRQEQQQTKLLTNDNNSGVE